MSTRFVVLAFAALSLAACETATTEDTGVHRGAAPTLGDLGHHPRVAVRGPVVADGAAVPARATHSATRHAAARSTATRTAAVVPNPLRASRSHTTAPTASTATVPATTPMPSSVPTEPVQQANITDEPVAPAATATDAQTPIGAYPASDPSAVPVSEPVQPTPPIDFGLGDLTIDKIEAMFGGMPFLLIASIAAALVAALGLALRSSPKPKRDEEYTGPHVVDHEDYREPYAA